MNQVFASIPLCWFNPAARYNEIDGIVFQTVCSNQHYRDTEYASGYHAMFTREMPDKHDFVNALT